MQMHLGNVHVHVHIIETAVIGRYSLACKSNPIMLVCAFFLFPFPLVITCPNQWVCACVWEWKGANYVLDTKRSTKTTDCMCECVSSCGHMACKSHWCVVFSSFFVFT